MNSFLDICDVWTKKWWLYFNKYYLREKAAAGFFFLYRSSWAAAEVCRRTCLLSGTLKQGGIPVIRWCVGNCGGFWVNSKERGSQQWVIGRGERRGRRKTRWWPFFFLPSGWEIKLLDSRHLELYWNENTLILTMVQERRRRRRRKRFSIDAPHRLTILNVSCLCCCCREAAQEFISLYGALIVVQ